MRTFRFVELYSMVKILCKFGIDVRIISMHKSKLEKSTSPKNKGPKMIKTESTKHELCDTKV